IPYKAINTAKTPTAAKMVATQMTSTPSSFGPLCVAEKLVMRRLIGMKLASLNLEIDHFGHNKAPNAHPNEATNSCYYQSRLHKEASDIIGIHEIDGTEHEKGKGTHDIGRGFCFG